MVTTVHNSQLFTWNLLINVLTTHTQTQHGDCGRWSVQFSPLVISDSLQPHGLQHTRGPCPLPASRSCSNSCPSSWWCHSTISSSVVSFSSCLQPFPGGSFPTNIGVSATASVLPMNIQDWFPLGWTGWISLQSKGLSRVFPNTTVQKQQSFGAQLSL